MRNIRADIKIILETAYGSPVRSAVLNEIEDMLKRAIGDARQEAQDAQTRAFFGGITDDDIGGGTD
ncbi:MAG: hypothetical protein KKH61_21450 [Gammaproteobacteria bacterium]|uniref:Uncharacterized protein n=2 Tax=viral metagenome TaxID=1070528 RepID=A0A6H1Z9N5_9ZZZZ|nr:hypothetical protein [Gammaproteobacteria bacterium]